MEERRNINRVDYRAKSVIVLCETLEKFYVDVRNVSPLGMKIKGPSDLPHILGKDIIVVADTLIMYAVVNRQKQLDDGRFEIGIEAKKFTPDVFRYLIEHIGTDDEEEEE